jgi:uncharacterized membrane protein YbhN (UPF0104 family)
VRGVPGTEGGRGRRFRRLTGALGVLLATLLVVLALARINLTQVASSLSSANPAWVAAAAALMSAAFLARGESWYVVLRAALPASTIPRAAVTRALLAGILGSGVTPGRVGEAARVWLIARRLGASRRVLSTIIGTLLTQTLLNVLALAMLAIVAFAAGATRGVHANLTAAIPLGAIVLALTAASALLALAGRSQSGRTHTVGRMARDEFVRMRCGLAVFRTTRTAAHAIAAQLGAWGLQLGTCYAVLVALHLEHRVDVAGAAAVLVAVNITAVIPLTPSNVGVFQAACITVLLPFGVSAGNGLAYGLVLQAIEMLSTLALGLPALVQEGASLAKLRRHAGDLARPAEIHS